MIIREKYLKRIRPFYHSDDIKILTGVRRCGKSTLMQQIKNELDKDTCNIISYDFENYDDALFCSKPENFYEDVKKRISIGKENFVFIDEVHYLEDFERIVASLRSALKCSVFITDSTSHLLSGSMGARFTGRSIEFQVFPFSFDEFAQITGMQDLRGLEYYMIHGGMPALYDSKSEDSGYVSRLYDGILERDIIQVKSVRNKEQFKKIASFVIENSSEIVSVDSIALALKKYGLSCSAPTVFQYITYLQDCFLISECKRFSIKGKQVLETLSKQYAVDTGFMMLQNNSHNLNLGHILETIVFNELKSRGYGVFIGKTYNGEIDFIASMNNEKQYYQVAYSLADEKVCEREFNAFSSIKDNYPKYIISMDTIDFSRDGIKHMNALDFLKHS